MMLTDEHLDLLCEIINIGVGQSANVLNKMVSHRVQLNVPRVELLRSDELASRLGQDERDNLSLVYMGFDGDFNGIASLVFSTRNAVKMVDLLTDEDYEQLEMDQLRSSAMNEVGNIVLNALIGTLGNMLESRFNYKIPQFVECKGQEVVKRQGIEEGMLVYAETQFTLLNHEIGGNSLIYIGLASLEELKASLDAHL